MKAAVLFGFNDVRIAQREVPAPGPAEALVKIEACGVCRRTDRRDFTCIAADPAIDKTMTPASERLRDGYASVNPVFIS
jgi:D-arabinose 1-dehydrogenase-like Zn-dependent alcohol dehydrogenase